MKEYYYTTVPTTLSYSMLLTNVDLYNTEMCIVLCLGVQKLMLLWVFKQHGHDCHRLVGKEWIWDYLYLKVMRLNLFQCNHNIVKQTVFIIYDKDLLFWNNDYVESSLAFFNVRKDTQTSQEQKEETSTSDHSLKIHFNNQKCCWWLMGKKLMWDIYF